MASFGTVNLKIRPIKIAFLVDPNEATQVRQAIQLSSTLWGGTYCPIITLYKKMPKTWREGHTKAPRAKDVILGYIDAFDPDIFIQLSKEVPDYIKDLKLKIIQPDDIWKVIDEQQSLSPKYGIGIFELYTDLFKQYFKYKAKYPLKIVIPKIPKKHSLFWASFLGELPPQLIPIVKKYYSESLEIEEIEFKPENIGSLLKGNILFPRKITQHALEHVRRSGFGRSAHAFFLDPSKIDDIVDFWNLRAMGRDVLPLPKPLLSNSHFKEVVVSFFKRNRRHLRQNETICNYASIVRSKNSTMKEVQDYARTLDIEPAPNDLSKTGFFSIQAWYPRVWDEWARDKDGAIPDDFWGEQNSIEINENDGLKISFRPLLPEFADKHAYHGEPRCVNEVNFHLYGSDEYLAEVFPKSSGENFIRSISSFGSMRDYWRVGRNGLVKLVKDNFREFWDIPEAQNVMFAWLQDYGWEPALSPAGILAKQIHKRLGGYPNILANEKLLGLLEYMNGGTVQASGLPVTNNRIRNERALPIGEIKNRLQNPSWRADLCDYLASKGVFTVGLTIQCPHCMRNSWFAIEKIENQFTCPKCLNPFPAIGIVDSGEWCYKTAGPFSVPNYAEGAYATLLALHFFDSYNLSTTLITPTLNFVAKSPNRKNLEADFALFWKDTIYGEEKNGLLFGECKTYGKFERRDFDRMSYLAKSFPGSIIVFATLRKALTAGEIKSLTRLAKAGRKFWKNERPINPVLVLTGNELLSPHGPPYCWEDAGIQGDFKHVHGLISICAATQQIYLSLSSWEREWHEKWEMQRQKRQLVLAKGVEGAIPD